MDQRPTAPPGPSPIAALLLELEERSRSRPDRVLRLRGTLPTEGSGEPFELLIYRGFSSLTTHPTAFDPDRPALPEGAVIAAAELLEAPLNPSGASPLEGPAPVERFRDPENWR